MADAFAERMAQVRARFATKLQDRLAALDGAIPQLIGDGDAVRNALESAHRTAHDLCGIGPTLGFVDTGRAARQVEQLLLEPLRAGRGLADQEASVLRSKIEALRRAGQAELQSHTASVE